MSTAQTEPQAVPETGEDDADRRARLVVNEVDQLLMQRDYDSSEIVVKRAIRAAVEAERMALASKADEWARKNREAAKMSQKHERVLDILPAGMAPTSEALVEGIGALEACGDEMEAFAAAIRARGEAS